MSLDEIILEAMLHVHWIDYLGCCQVPLAGEDGTDRNQIGIVTPDRSVAIVAVTIVLLPYNKMAPVDKRE
jgi:hypothetical protein